MVTCSMLMLRIGITSTTLKILRKEKNKITNVNLLWENATRHLVPAVYLKFSGYVCLSQSNTLQPMIENLLEKYPKLILHCEILQPPEPCGAKWENLIVNGELFALRSNNYTTRRKELERLERYLNSKFPSFYRIDDDDDHNK